MAPLLTLILVLLGRIGSETRCIFCQILARQAPSYTVYEDNHVVAFLDINPAAPYHTLVVPRAHTASFHELTPDQAAHLGRALPTIAKAVQAASQCDGYNLVQNNGHAAGQRVFHVHVHIIPRHTGDQLVSYRENGVLKDSALAKAQRDKIRALIS
eukprot:comp5265_c0_seq1/m.1293 comp5265_c0_seq1/g.1293  ORF comp5265_c0_seq1/g.1293 comp5265_c0_seq1/m.1293 type:complete len:156 (-) comp5265_c0_seq1:649-1116(-)